MDIFVHISIERALQATVELISKIATTTTCHPHTPACVFPALGPGAFLDNLCPQFDVSPHAVKQILALTKSAGSMKFHPEYSWLR
jgi:hypothetical protein